MRDRTTTDLDERGLGSQRPVQNLRGLTLIVIVEAAVEVEAVTRRSLLGACRGRDVAALNPARIHAQRIAAEAWS